MRALAQPRRLARVFTAGITYLFVASGCATVDHRPTTPATVTAVAAGIVSCADGQREPLQLRPHEPLAVLVHGCHSSPARLARLRDALTREGQQVACFRYRDRASIEETGRDLRGALRTIEQQLAPTTVMVLGHSQGGLVARAALSQQVPALHAAYRLVSVAAPFNGIAAATSCGSRALHAATLGISAAICRSIAGKNWSEIHARAAQVREPPPLDPAVRDHLMVVTDEASPLAPRDDFVFTTAEQRNDRMVRDRRVSSVVLAVGHAAAVGEGDGSPAPLMNVLRRAGRLRREAIHPGTIAEQRAENRFGPDASTHPSQP